ncbi:MAG: short-chain dehydrogenase [Cellvibrionaceae bacterium]|nr:short-chain dehydrogenase [Cellvibrionaceae bacterium]
MGPPIAAAFKAEGAEVIESTDKLLSQTTVDQLVQSVGDIDILVANFAEPPRPGQLAKIDDEDWFQLFDSLTHPLMRICRAIVPGMKNRGRGKVVAVTSASSLRGIPGYSGYCAARGAQNAFIRAIGLEYAPHNVQINAIAQNYVENDTYYPPGLLENEKFQARLKEDVPTQAVAKAEETGELALYLASDKCTHMVGQVLPWAGGWVTTTG